VPAQQSFAAVGPAETVVAALAPSAPTAVSIPETSGPAGPTPLVPADAVPSIDPLARATDYVSAYDAGACAHLTVTSAGPNSAQVTAFGAGIEPFALFDKAFAADVGYEANIEVRLITRQQCPLLDALGLSGGVEAAGLVDLDRTLVRSGTRISGTIGRDLPLDRIAAAEAEGVSFNGRGPPELYLIDDAGQIHDGRDFVVPETHAVSAGRWRFTIPVTLISRQQQETALVLAIWNRTRDDQPGRFGTLPASRMGTVLENPGVYSLSAFKVSR